MLRQKEHALRANEGVDPSELQKKKQKKAAPVATETETPEDAFAAAEATLRAAIAEVQETTEKEKVEEKVKEEKEEAPRENREAPLVNSIQRRLSILLEEQAIQSTSQAGEFAVSSYQESFICNGCFCG